MAYTTLTAVKPLSFTEIANTCDSCKMVQDSHHTLVSYGDEHNTFIATCFNCSSSYDVYDHCTIHMERIEDMLSDAKEMNSTHSKELGRLYHELRTIRINAQEEILRIEAEANETSQRLSAHQFEEECPSMMCECDDCVQAQHDYWNPPCPSTCSCPDCVEDKAQQGGER
jgi:hypothetical protein